MARRRRARFVALTTLLAGHPDVADPIQAIADRRVQVDGRIITNPRARVPAGGSIRITRPRPLRGETKLGRALDAFGIDPVDMIAADLGAAAGGFTRALLGRGARRVYAVDAGYGQLIGSLRQDERVVNLERTNIADLDDRLIPDRLGLITSDLSYLPVADAIGQLGQLDLHPDAVLISLIKPTFELRRPRLATGLRDVHTAIERATGAIELHGWRVIGITLPATTGANGAVEAFVHAVARARPSGAGSRSATGPRPTTPGHESHGT